MIRKNILIGYLRSSSEDDHLLQKEKLQMYGCDLIFEDKERGSKGIDAALNYLSNDDTLVIYNLSSIGKSIFRVINNLSIIENKKIHLVSIVEGFSLKLSDNIFTILNKNYGSQNNTYSKQRGKQGGRKSVLNKEQCLNLKKMYIKEQKNIDEICYHFNISRPTFFRYIKKAMDL